EIDTIVRRINYRERDRQQQVSLENLMIHVNKGRGNGYVFSEHTLEPGAGSIAMLLPERRFNRVFAIGVHGPVERLTSKKHAILTALSTGVAQLRETSQPRHP